MSEMELKAAASAWRQLLDTPLLPRLLSRTGVRSHSDRVKRAFLGRAPWEGTGKCQTACATLSAASSVVSCFCNTRAHAKRGLVNLFDHLVGKQLHGRGSLGHLATLRFPSRSSNRTCPTNIRPLDYWKRVSGRFSTTTLYHARSIPDCHQGKIFFSGQLSNMHFGPIVRRLVDLKMTTPIYETCSRKNRRLNHEIVGANRK